MLLQAFLRFGWLDTHEHMACALDFALHDGGSFRRAVLLFWLGKDGADLVLQTTRYCGGGCSCYQSLLYSKLAAAIGRKAVRLPVQLREFHFI